MLPFELKTFLKSNFLLFLLPVLGFLVYTNSLHNGFVLDDASQLTNQPSVQSYKNIPKLFLGSTFAGGAGLSGVYYKPLMSSSYAIIYSLFGPKQFYFHLFQLLLHIANGVLVFLVLKKFLKGNLAFFMALVFLVHPLNSESVLYISALQEPLFFFFGSLAFLTILKEDLETVDYLFFAFLIFLSLLSKEAGLLFLIISITSRFIFTKGDRKLVFGKDKLTFVFFSLLIFIAYAFIRFKAVGLPKAGDLPYPIMRIPIGWRIVGIPAEVFYYLRNFFFPYDFAVAEHWVITKISWQGFWMPLAADLAVIFGVFCFGLRLLRRKASQFKTYVFFLIWFVLGMAMHSNILPLDVTVADRWFYFPMVGVLGILGVIFQEFPVFPRKTFLSNFQFPIKKYIIFAAILVILALSVRTIIRTRDWKDGLTLASRDIKYSHDSFPLENNLGFELIGAGRWDEALVHAQKSVELGPWWWLNWNNLGVVYRHKAMSDSAYADKAVDAFKKATENTDAFYMPYENMAEFLLFYKNPKDASDFIVETSKKLNLSSRLWFLLGIAQYQLGNKQAAMDAVYQARLTDSGGPVESFYNALLAGNQVRFEKPVY